MISGHPYFQAADSLFFRWEDDGSVLTWDNGVTIAFRDELVAVMERLAPDGLPPFNAIAALLSACRGNWSDARWFMTLFDSPQGLDDVPLGLDVNGWEANQFRVVRAKLDQIHGLPESLRSKLEVRCELAEMVFEDRSSDISPKMGLALAHKLSAGLPPDEQSQGGLLEAIGEHETSVVDSMKFSASGRRGTTTDTIRNAVTQFNRDLFAMRDGLQRVDTSSLSLRVKTGIENQVLPDEAEETHHARDLIADLVNDDELGGIARLAKNLFAIVHFPRSLTEQDDLPLGGVSDITNRGQLDRLLISELAHDDLTLAVRVAINEAMYLRRESPPRQKAKTRYLLIDSGLCMWGTPRVYAAAAALAMAATGEADTKVCAWRAEGPTIVPVDLSQRDGLEAHLSVVCPDLHAGPALMKFVEQQSDDEQFDAETSEFVIITSEDAAADPVFRSSLTASCEASPWYLMTVTRNGHLQFSACSSRGRKLIREVRLDLASVLAPRKQPHTLKRTGVDGNLPAILCRPGEFPLRLPHGLRDDWFFAMAEGAVAVTSDGRVMLWTDAKRGAIELTSELGEGTLQWQGWGSDGELMFVFGKKAGKKLMIVQVFNDRTIEITRIRNSDRPIAVSGVSGKVFVIFNGWIESYDPGTIDATGRTPIPDGVHHRSKLLNDRMSGCSAASRFFVKGSKWFALSDGAHGPVLTHVPTDGFTTAMFDQLSFGPVAIIPPASSSNFVEEAPALIGNVSQILGIANDGRMIVVAPNATIQHHRVKGVRVLAADHNSVSASKLMMPDAFALISDRNLRKRFSAIGVLAGKLCLRSSRGGVAVFSTVSIPEFQGSTQLAVQPNWIPFEHIPGPPNVGFELKAAEWPNGSRAILDSRGLLHLQSSNSAEVPEITLVLREGRLSGWCEENDDDEDDGCFGLPYFTKNGTETPGHSDAIVCRQAIDSFVEATR